MNNPGHKLIRSALGLNIACLIRGARFGFRDAIRNALGASHTTNPFENASLVESRKMLEAIPAVPLDRLLPGGGETKLLISTTRREVGALPLNQLLVLLQIATHFKPARVLEIGTFMGHTTCALAENLPDAQVHTVDLPESFSADEEIPAKDAPPKDDFHLIQTRIPGREWSGSSAAARITQHRADTAKWDFAPATVGTMFFIDGSHTYEYCRNDSEKCWERCAGKGIFVWHDCDESHPGVLQALLEWRRKGRPVVRIAGTPLGFLATV